MTRRTVLVSILVTLISAADPAKAVDAFSFGVGRGLDDTPANIYRWGVLWDWRSTWLSEGAWYLGGYHELSASYIDSDEDGDVVEGGYTAMLHFQRHRPFTTGLLPFLDAGIGIHLLSDTKIGNTDVSTFVQFSPNAGFGISFGERQQYEIGYRFWHLSNANIGRTNPGLNFHLARFSYRF